MSDAVRDAARVFLAESIDDAGLFPPAKLALDEALVAHERAADGPYGWMLGRFVVPASRLGELGKALGSRATPLRATVVFDRSIIESFAALAHEIHAGSGAVLVEAIELKLDDLPGDDPADKAAKLNEFERVGAFVRPPAIYLEIGIADDAHLELNLQAFARPPAGEMLRFAKVRCGGPDASAVPAPSQLAQFIARTRDLSIPFKATAGLHHAIRHRDAQAGFAMHGFLNVAGAAILARTHAFDRSKLEALLLDENGPDFRLSEKCFEWRGAMATADEIAAARKQSFHSFGSCSLAEPTADLVALGILR
jgi:hypothetical protein